MSATDLPSALIVGCAGLTLADDERRLFARLNPLGFILFGRNVGDPDQVRALVAALRDSVGRPDAPVLVDQEGGRVRRLGPPWWRKAPPGAPFGRLAARDPQAGGDLLRLNYRLIGAELAELGIDVDCAPVLDVPVRGAHDVIGDRAFSADPALVADLARAALLGLLDEGVIPVIKHIPGHGRALVDSHHHLPVVDAPIEVLEESDFVPFRALADDAPWAMTAHVVYTALDPTAPATESPRVIDEVIRGRLGFGGVLISDDLSMKALGGSFERRTKAALDAGCDVVLHCNGSVGEMEAIGRAIRPLTDSALDRLARAERMKRPPVPFDRLEAARQIDRALAGEGG